MKKFQLIFLVSLIITLLIPSLMIADANDGPVTPGKYTYKITPDSEEWGDYSPPELRNILDIPLEFVREMDTDFLIATVLDYPYIGDILAFSTYEQGIEVVSSRFSGLDELLKRKDAPQALCKEYSNLCSKLGTDALKDNQEPFGFVKHRVLEAILMQPFIYNYLSQTEINSVIESSIGLAKSENILPIHFRSETPYSQEAMDQDLLRALVFTPNGSPVIVGSKGELLSPAQKSNMDNYMALIYPNATRLRSATTMYNCHSYAWYSTSASNSYWLE